MIREFTVKLPKMKKVFGNDPDNPEPFKDISVDLSLVILSDDIISKLNDCNISWLSDDTAKISTSSTDLEIEQCLYECKLIPTTNRTDIIHEINNIEIKSEYTIDPTEKTKLENHIIEEEKKESLIEIIKILDETKIISELKLLDSVALLKLKTEIKVME